VDSPLIADGTHLIGGHACPKIRCALDRGAGGRQQKRSSSNRPGNLNAVLLEIFTDMPVWARSITNQKQD